MRISELHLATPVPTENLPKTQQIVNSSQARKRQCGKFSRTMREFHALAIKLLAPDTRLIPNYSNCPSYLTPLQREDYHRKATFAPPLGGAHGWPFYVSAQDIPLRS